MAQLVWERVKDFYKKEENDVSSELRGAAMRASVPPGWIVRVVYNKFEDHTDAMTFVPDPHHEWK
jgi:hypothetical protein